MPAQGLIQRSLVSPRVFIPTVVDWDQVGRQHFSLATICRLLTGCVWNSNVEFLLLGACSLLYAAPLQSKWEIPSALLGFSFRRCKAVKEPSLRLRLGCLDAAASAEPPTASPS